jgi:YesN/AraC family two-component response regulator
LNFTILYVDDERQNLVSFTASFRRYYNIHTAQSGQEALDIMRQHHIDLVISDQRMPEMTGVQLFEKILKEFPDPIRMVMTGYSDMHAIVDAVNKGKIYYYIAKPWKHDELKLILDNALESYRLKMENRELAEERNELIIKSERQSKQNILSQFETLKNQVNPHFLFNCLNALASLVHDDPEKAEDFITKMTKVYRYVLEHKELVLVPVEEEMRFMKDYFFLQKTRFGENLKLKIEVAPEFLQKSVPPLTFQLLAENAIKHNIISREKPLTIEIFTIPSGHLIMGNNLQLRTEGVASLGIGLQNLKDRYGFLSDQQPEFYEEDGFYVAKIPLLE